MHQYQQAWNQKMTVVGALQFPRPLLWICGSLFGNCCFRKRGTYKLHPPYLQDSCYISSLNLFSPEAAAGQPVVVETTMSAVWGLLSLHPFPIWGLGLVPGLVTIHPSPNQLHCPVYFMRPKIKKHMLSCNKSIGLHEVSEVVPMCTS